MALVNQRLPGIKPFFPAVRNIAVQPSRRKIHEAEFIRAPQDGVIWHGLIFRRAA
jgi:hypothetical protein